MYQITLFTASIVISFVATQIYIPLKSMEQNESNKPIVKNAAYYVLDAGNENRIESNVIYNNPHFAFFYDYQGNALDVARKDSKRIDPEAPKPQPVRCIIQHILKFDINFPVKECSKHYLVFKDKHDNTIESFLYDKEKMVAIFNQDEREPQELLIDLVHNREALKEFPLDLSLLFERIDVNRESVDSVIEDEEKQVVTKSLDAPKSDISKCILF